MASAYKNTCAPEAPVATEASPAPARADGDVPAPENLLQEYKELRERYRRTTNALASAAHDLKTPLSILNGYVELLHSEKLGPLSERQRDVLQDMRDSGKRLQQFIQDFLTYSALETGGGLRMRFDMGNLNECLSGVCRLWSNRFQQKGIALYFLANDKVPLFPFDAPKVERIISNLLENSFKFTPQAGTVWLHAEPYMWERRTASLPSTSERRRQNFSHPNSVKVSVSDTGPGIPAEFHLEVFDDFFRLPGNENQEGMGLGLAIVRRLVQAMGGKIWVESDPGAGCKFSFLMPYKPAVAAPSKGKHR
jgi:signal transduction histidine kinase